MNWRRYLWLDLYLLAWLDGSCSYFALERMKLRRWIFGALLCMVLIKPLILILALGVPIFFQDEWGLVSFIEKVWHGQSTFYDYWTSLGEHRIFFPRLIFASVYHPESVDPRQVMILSWFLISVTYSVAVWYFFLKPSGMADYWKFLYAFCFLSLGLSLVQYENWLWALQLDFFLTQVFVMLAAIFIGIDSLGIGTRSLLVACCAAAASLCSGQGMLLWLSGILGVLLIARTWVSRGLLVFSFICGMVFFLWLYHADGSDQLQKSSQLFWIINNPLEGLRSYFGLVGNPLADCFGSSRVKVAPIVGVALTTFFAGQMCLVLRRKLLRRSTPFILLASFGFFYCGLVTLGRATNGINEYLLTSRYTTDALSIPLAMVGLSFSITLFGRRQERGIDMDLLLLNIPLFLVLALSFISEVHAIDWAIEDSSMRRFATRLLPFVTLFDDATDGVSTGPFYPLCPVEKATIVNDTILPWMKVGFIPGPRDVNAMPPARISVQLKSDALTKNVPYLSHHLNVRVIEGWTRVPEGITPQAILLRKPGEAKFLTATRLVREKRAEEGFFVYRFKFLILPVLASGPAVGFEAALLDEKAAILYPLEDGFR